MDPREFQQLALKLVSGVCAAEFRTAISRAYYATYNVCFEILEKMGFHIKEGPSGHGDVRFHLGNSGDIDVIKVISQLSDLHSKRIQADYRMKRTDVENQKTAHAYVEQAKQMIQVLDSRCYGSNRSKIIQSIKEWEQKIYGTP